MLSNKMCVFGWGAVWRGEEFFGIAVVGVSLWLGLSPLVARGCFSSFLFNHLLNVCILILYVLFTLPILSPVLLGGEFIYLSAVVNLPQALWFENETSEDSFTFSAQWSVSPYESFIFISRSCVISCSITDSANFWLVRSSLVSSWPHADLSKIKYMLTANYHMPI